MGLFLLIVAVAFLLFLFLVFGFWGTILLIGFTLGILFVVRLLLSRSRKPIV